MRRSMRKRSRTSEPTNSVRNSACRRVILRQPAATVHTLRPARQPAWRAEPVEESAARPARRRRPPRRPQRQQIVLRRALALGAGLVVLILIVIGVKGCLDARKNRALSDYAGDVTQIVKETQQTSNNFFAKLEDPGELSVTDFT